LKVLARESSFFVGRVGTLVAPNLLGRHREALEMNLDLGLY
jgi:hypothetical protein